jgi:hypothetical protein
MTCWSRVQEVNTRVLLLLQGRFSLYPHITGKRLPDFPDASSHVSTVLNLHDFCSAKSYAWSTLQNRHTTTSQLDTVESLCAGKLTTKAILLDWWTRTDDPALTIVTAFMTRWR